MTKTYSISIAVDGLYATRGKFQYSEGEGIRSGFIEDCDAPWDDAIYTAIEEALTEGEPADGQLEIEGKTYSWTLTAEAPEVEEESATVGHLFNSPTTPGRRDVDALKKGDMPMIGDR